MRCVYVFIYVYVSCNNFERELGWKLEVTAAGFTCGALNSALLELESPAERQPLFSTLIQLDRLLIAQGLCERKKSSFVAPTNLVDYVDLVD